MSKKSKNGDGNQNLPPEDFRLWKAFTKDIKSFKDKNDAHFLENTNLFAKQTTAKKRTAPPAQPPQIDTKTQNKLKKGEVPIEARLDLHGQTQEMAHQSLHSFLLRCHKAGMRCVLVITGKGGAKATQPLDKPPIGVLKRMLPLWLENPSLKAIVLKIIPAKPKDGGGGAFYIYLKRDRGQ